MCTRCEIFLLQCSWSWLTTPATRSSFPNFSDMRRRVVDSRLGVEAQHLGLVFDHTSDLEDTSRLQVAPEAASRRCCFCSSAHVAHGASRSAVPCRLSGVYEAHGDRVSRPGRLSAIDGHVAPRQIALAAVVTGLSAWRRGAAIVAAGGQLRGLAFLPAVASTSRWLPSRSVTVISGS